MGFSRIKECLDLVIFCLSSISPQLSPTSLSPLFLHFYVCACSVRACASPKITLRYPRNQTTNDNIIAQAFQNMTQKKCVVATLTCNNPLIDPCGFCISPPLFPLFSLLGCHISTLLTARASEPQWRSGAPCRRCFVT